MKKLIRQFVTILLAAILPAIESLAADFNTLVIFTKDGTSAGYALEKQPVLTFSEYEMIITGKGIEVTYSLSDLARYSYSSEYESGIKDIRTDKVLPNFDGESLLFPSLKANSIVSVYTLNGTQVFNKTILTDGEYSFPLSALNAGAYLVNVNGLTYKIVKK
jgi:hypothetical protein